MTDGSDDHQLAFDIIDVHGRGVAAVARENARAAAIGGQAARARSWIRVLAIIQHRGPTRASAARFPATSGKSKKRFPKQLNLCRHII